MARAVRHEYAGAVYHVMCRGNNGQPVFREEKGFRLFLSTLEEVCTQTGWHIHAYVLMSNHYHLLLETPEANLVAGMKWFQGSYTQRFNAMFKCRGHLFQGRYKSLPIDADEDSVYFREVGHYIHLNPFRAGIVGLGMDKPLESYRWSSYPSYVCNVKRPSEWLHRQRLLEACGIDPAHRMFRSRYKALVDSRMLGESDKLAAETIAAVEKQIRRGWYVGGSSFRDWLTEMLDGPSDNLRGEQRRAHDEMEAERLLKLFLRSFDISEEVLLSMKCTAIEKQAAVWLLKKHTTVTVSWLANRLSMGHRTNASRALSGFEKRKGSARLKSKMLHFTV